MLDSFTHTHTQKNKGKISFRLQAVTWHVCTHTFSETDWLKSVNKKKKNTSCSVYIKLRCGMHNNESENVVLAKVQRCEESFIGTFVKRGSLPAFYRKCRRPIIQKCDAVRSLQVLSSLLTPCQCCSLGNGTVEGFFSSPPPQKTGWKKKSLHPWVP